jgi:uncharacterized membrane protein YbaN (DUF454 family)
MEKRPILMSRLIRWPSLLLAYLFLALGLVGVVLPGLPTVPFLLLTAWFAARGSERLHRWLYAHPHLGRLLIDWEQQGAISRRSKIIAAVLLLFSWLVMYFRVGQDWVMAVLAVLFIIILGFLLSRPEPVRGDSS